MSPQDIELLKIYVLASPFLVFCVALGVYWRTGWLDRWCEERRQTAAE